MFFVQSLFALNLFRIVYSEWIEISQSGHSLDESAANNRSLVTTNGNTFDYSTYKDFFSIIEPEIELVKNMTSVQQNSIFSNKLNDPNGGDSHMIVANPTEKIRDQTEKNHLLMHPSNVSTLISVFSDSTDKVVVDPIQENEQTPNRKQNTIVFKHLEFKPLDFKNILKFLTNMQQSFSVDSLTGIGDKVKFLVQFKDSLLENIGERFKLLWPSHQSQANRRVRRSSSSHGSVDFPASETALMTISFLTLAVFLIKLVLQVISVIKSKHVGLQTLTPSVAPIKIIKTNLNARKLSVSTDDLRTTTETMSSIEKSIKMYT